NQVSVNVRKTAKHKKQNVETKTFDKGIKGISLRIHIETKTKNSATSNTIEKAFTKVKLFRDKWKYTRACLASNKFCRTIVDKRIVFCVYRQKVTLNNDYNKSRLNEYSNNSRCKVNNKKRQLGLPELFLVLPNPSKKKKNSPSSFPLPILLLSSLSPPPTLSSLSSSSPLPMLLSLSLYPNKPCSGLCSEQIRSYINRILSTYGSAQRYNIIGKEMFQDKFLNQMKFNFKKLNKEEVLQFNQQIIAESEWFIDHFDKLILARSKLLITQNLIIWFYNLQECVFDLLIVKESLMSRHGTFEQKPVFKELCHIILQATKCEEQNKGLQNLKYSNKRHRSISDDIINNPDLCYENVAHFKRLLDTLHYKGPDMAMTNCMKVKARLQFSSSLDCIVESTLNQNDCIIKTYNDIYNKVSNIKQKNAIAKYIRVPLPKFLPVIVALIPTRNDDSEKIFALHQILIEIAANLELYIISIGSDGAAAEFQAQNLLQATKTKYRVQYRNL
ncbi:43690_t:CDS:2, partial [Gigaspora margarita]